MAKYDEFTSPKNPGRKVQVESAKRDGAGKNIENNYAKQTGHYSTLTAGQAEAIASNREIEDAEIACPPISFGIAGDEAEIQTGINKLEYLEGKSIKFNQILKDFAATNYWGLTTGTFNNISNTESVFTLKNDAQYNSGIAVYQSTVVGHKYLLLATVKTSVDNANIAFRQDDNYSFLHSTTSYKQYSWIHTATGKSRMFCMFLNSGVSGDTMTIKNCMCFDLTEMFGAGNEPTTVEEFKALFPLDYYEYNAGSILSSKSASLISRGKNQFSALNTFIPVIGGEEYEISGISAGGVLTQYDASKNLIATSDTFTDTVDITLEDNTAFVKIAATTYEDIMFYLTFPEDGGVYNEPYIAPRVETVTLPNIELRSVPNFEKTEEIRDIAYASGGGKRRVGIVDLGSLTWGQRADSYIYYAQNITGLKIHGGLLCAKYTHDVINQLANIVNKSMWNTTNGYGNDSICIRDDSYTSAADFKTAMSGVYLLYELDDETDIPTSENAGWTPEVFVDNFGTLEFTTSPAQVPQVEQPYFIRYTVSLVEFLDTGYVKCKGDGNNIATQEEVDEMKAGNVEVGLARVAENLTPYSENSGAEDDSAFTMQTAGGEADIGSIAQMKALRGNTIKWGQYVQNGDFSNGTSNYQLYTSNGSYSVEDNVLTFTRSIDTTNNYYLLRFSTGRTITSHKCLVVFEAKASASTRVNISSTNGNWGQYTFTTSWKQYNFFPSSGNVGDILLANINENFIPIDGTISFRNIMCFDLTEMFGAGNEPTTVAEFNRIFPKPYYEYNAGELLSSKVNGIKNVGYNAFDKTLAEDNKRILRTGDIGTLNNVFISGYVKVIPNQTYTIEGLLGFGNQTGHLGCFYDGNKNYISGIPNVIAPTSNSESFTIPENAYYIIFNGLMANKDTTCLHLTWDSSRTGYEPYESETYPLPNVELRSAGSVYDELKPDGTLIRRVGVLNFGEQTWTERTDIASGIYQCNITGQRTVPELQAVCDKYSFVGGVYSGSSFASATNGQCSINVTSGFVYVKSSSAPTSGTLYYELAEPTEEQTENTYQELMSIDDFGTQEFLYDNDVFPVPQGNEFFYPVDYKAFIDSLGGREDINYGADEIVSHDELTEALSEFLSSISGYDETKTQTLKNVEGTFTWVDDE